MKGRRQQTPSAENTEGAADELGKGSAKVYSKDADTGYPDIDPEHERLIVEYGLGLQHARLLDESSIDPEIARTRGYRTVRTKAELKRLRFSPAQQRPPAMVIPIHGVKGGIVGHQIRPDEPRNDRNGKIVKYETPMRQRMALDCHPTNLESLGNPNIPLYITEGIRKADAATSRGLCCIALLGVWNWRGTNEDGGKTILADFDAIALNEDRWVFVIFDSDAATSAGVRSAGFRLVRALESRGADASFTCLPSGPGGRKMGLDDYFAMGKSIDDLAAERIRPSEIPTGKVTHPYTATDSGIFLTKETKTGPVVQPLTNFTARITADTVLRNGVDEERCFDLEATVKGRTKLVSVAAEQFANLSWVAPQLGASALIYPGNGNRDHARAAIQELSTDIEERRVRTHTGWIRSGGRYLFLHAGGALYGRGDPPSISVKIDGPLANFRFPEVTSSQDMVEAVQESLATFLRVAPLTVTVPLLGTVVRAPLKNADFSVHLSGGTGNGKSELAALDQQYFGSKMDRPHLPASWSSTANSLEELAFLAKDVVLVVDDFAPMGSSYDVQKIHAVSERLLRSAGNHSGRGRMRADTTLRSVHPPRALILSTGEDGFRGQSLNARVLTLEVGGDSVRWDKLSEAQELASGGVFAIAMAGFVSHLARNHRQRIREFTEMKMKYFSKVVAADIGAHKRTPGIIADLGAALEMYLEFAFDLGALSEAKRSTLSDRFRKALLAQGMNQERRVVEANPVERFLAAVRSLLAAQRAHFVVVGETNDDEDEDEDHFDLSWGGNGGEQLGYVENGRVYVNLAVALSVAQRLLSSGDTLACSEKALRKGLLEGGYLTGEGEPRRQSSSVRRRFEGSRVSWTVIRAEHLQAGH